MLTECAAVAENGPEIIRSDDEGESVRVFGFAGWSGSGKTTLIEKVIPQLVARGKKVSLIKHVHHGFDIDTPGKDSHRHRRAGCTEVLVSSQDRWALMHELRGAAELSLEAALSRLAPCDLVLIEGYKKTEAVPKLEIHRGVVGKPLLYPDDPRIIGVATDIADLKTARPPAMFDIDDAAAIADFVLERAVALERVETEGTNMNGMQRENRER